MSNNHTPKFEFKLNEENELDFKLSIEGSVSDQDMAKPVFRFVMTENNSDKGWVFPVKTKYKGSDIFTVKIPALNENVQENALYNGRLEVIMGNVLMVPTEVMLEFKRPLGIKALPIAKSNIVSEAPPVLEKKQEKSDAVLEEEIDAIIGAAPKSTPVATPKSPLLFNNVMNFLEEEKAQKLAKRIIEERKKQSVQPKTLPAKKTTPQKTDSADKEQIKSQLKNLFRSALK